MLLWIILTAMTSAAAVWLTAPLLRRIDDRRAANANDVEVYRDQLAEVEREKAEGLIDADQATAAGLEIKRRMLEVGRNATGVAKSLSLGERHFAVASVAGIVVLGSTILYANSGRPDLPSVARPATTLVLGGGGKEAGFRPLRAGSPVVPVAATAAAPAQSPQVPTQAAAAQPAAAPAAPSQTAGSLDEMIDRLVTRLKKDPGNVDTWRMLGWSYAATERFPEAADAYAKAVALAPKNAALQSALGEARVRTAGGEVKPDAIAAFDAALAADAKEPRARYFKGVVLEQGGKKPEALETWIAVLRDAAPEEAWVPELRSRVEELARELKADIAGRLPPTPTDGAEAPAGPGLLAQLQAPDPATTGSLAAPARGPTATDVKAAEAMSPADRSAMIKNMVDGLASRLEKSPRDADGWIQLIRSRKVLGDADAARASLDKALSAFADTPAEQSRISAAAAELGVVR
jgi:cytochrome c-type biogenesis protein CcmH